ncbi:MULTISPECIES: hypothetical protein [Psychrilyobacter]|uniref:Uncharacterized protein n=1 Tax=Psychrilyobacter piezotolerans TaxID=2293438 RepID=A0ABX9KHL3_9FUSO|nr:MULTISPECIES: hypothetical protein [Psychrilyobacter]MCS5423099.1 hypothetical protein [Psychrilyobacter sp. S5]NDI77901.1 hypothetical protein [Psychrilyobacter piezotolerans]RDE62019.1 hypothetical protein DV867_07465 [Psychrilyobacter sp. S5]REI41266.1 hypothetical protein DYH56_07465 [Psychrilyobacter piezotolerans]
MELEKLMPLIISGISALVAGVSACYIRKANKLIALQLESQIRARIDDAYKEILNFKDGELLDSVIENYFNAYDYACKKYLNKELNRKNFRGMYTHEIKNLCTKEIYVKQRKNGDFRDIKKVYEEIKKIGDK